MTDRETSAEGWQARAELAEAALSRLQAEQTAKTVQAELRVEAIKAGMIDLDGLKLLDIAEIKLSESGEPIDASINILNLKRQKPWLFGGVVSSSAALAPPRPEPPKVRHANELTHEEWVSARAALLKRR